MSDTTKASRALTDTEYLHFDELPPLAKTRRFVVQAMRTRAYLGDIRWFGRWRQYCFFPQAETVFNVGCLSDINDRLAYLNTMHREGRSALAAGEEKPDGRE